MLDQVSLAQIFEIWSANQPKSFTAKIKQQTLIPSRKNIAVKKTLNRFTPEMVKFAYEEFEKNGKISVSYLSKKLKCSFSTSKEIIEHLNLTT